ncbi:hypothetical protein ACN06F_09085 [Vreelandella sp. 21]|uniref:hypothetical protein n=1 Tax=Vreelandella sp. 21 TaxID=3402864 RepID=UPI003D9A626B
MSFEQAVVQLEQTNSKLQEEVVRFRDAAMGLNAIYSTITEGRQNTADGKYFSVPGNGAYMRLYRRQGSSAELIAEFPDRNELNSVIDQLGPLLGRDVTTGLNSFGSDSSLVRLRDIVYASRAYFGSYYSGSSTSGNVDLAKAGECALYSSSNEGVFPSSPGITFFWVETQSTYSGESLLQTATNYTGRSPSKARQWIRVCANSPDTNGGRQWGPWGEIYTSQNILGTVSQSNGIPTGAIIERGSNANGEYAKYADGTLIIHTAYKEITVEGNGSDGSVEFDLPTSTRSLYSNGFAYVQNTGGSAGLSNRGRARCETPTTARVRIVNEFPTSSTATMVLTHIGRWYD